MTDLATFILDNTDNVFYVYLKGVNPEGNVYLGEYYFEKGIELPNKDVLIEMRNTFVDYTETEEHEIIIARDISDNLEYYLLSEIVFVNGGEGGSDGTSR